jgi:hypothetical protein
MPKLFRNTDRGMPDLKVGIDKTKIQAFIFCYSASRTASSGSNEWLVAPRSDVSVRIVTGGGAKPGFS